MLAFSDGLRQGDPQSGTVPLTVSKSPQEISQHPQVVLGNDGEAYVIWSENGEIWYNRCENGACGEPINLTNGEEKCAPDSNKRSK